MSNAQIVWLLYPPSPSPNVSTVDHHRRVWSTRNLDGSPWWMTLWIQFWTWWRRHDLPQLTDNCPSLQYSQAQHLELNRILGPDFDCRSVHYLHDSFQTEIQNIPSKSKILLVPMMPFWSTQTHTMIDDIQSKLSDLGHQMRVVEPISQRDEFIEAYAQIIRQAIIEADFPTQYNVLFLLQRDIQYWNILDPKLEKALHLFQHKLHTHLPINIDIAVNDGKGNWPKFAENQTIFYGFINVLCSSYEELAPELQELPYTWVPLSAFNTQPALMFLLARTIEEMVDSK